MPETAEPKPIAHLRPKRKTRARLSKVATARDTIAGFDHDMDVLGLTFGQFSLLDLLQAALNITGPADLTIGTWAVGRHDLDYTHGLWRDGRIRSLRMIIDAMKNTERATPADVAALIGAENVRTTKTHAKWITIVNDDWNVLITTSMNLNYNARNEQFEMTDDAERCGLFVDWVDALFDELPEGDANGETLAQARGMTAVAPVHPIEVTRRIEAASAIRTGA